MLLPDCNAHKLARAVCSENTVSERESENESENDWCSVAACMRFERVRAYGDKECVGVVKEINGSSSDDVDVEGSCWGARVVSEGDKDQRANVESDESTHNDRTSNFDVNSDVHNNIKSVSFLSWNVNGLISKLLDREFASYV